MSKFKFGRLPVDLARSSDKQEMVRQEENLDVVEQEFLTRQKAIGPSLEVVNDETHGHDGAIGNSECEQTPVYPEEVMGKCTLPFEGVTTGVGEAAGDIAIGQSTTFEEVRGIVVIEHPEQFHDEDKQIELENFVNGSAGPNLPDQIISIGDYSGANNRNTGKSTKKVTPSTPRPNEHQQTFPETLPEEVQPNLYISEPESTDTVHELQQTTNKRKTSENEFEEDKSTGKKARTENLTINYPILFNQIISTFENQIPEKMIYLRNFPFKVSHKLELCNQSDMHRFVDSCIQNCASQNTETTDESFHSRSNSNYVEQNGTESIPLAEEDHFSNLSKTNHEQKKKVNALSCEVEDISSDEQETEQHSSDIAVKVIGNENINSGNPICEFEMTSESKTTEDDEILDLSCKKKHNKRKRKEPSPELLYPEVNCRSRGKQPKFGNQCIKRTRKEKTQATPIFGRVVPPEIDKSAEIGQNSSSPLNRNKLLIESEKTSFANQLLNDGIKKLGSLVSRVLDDITQPSAKMPNFTVINPEIPMEFNDDKENGDKEKPNVEAKHKLQKLLRSTKLEKKKSEAQKGVHKFSFIRVREIKTEVLDPEQEAGVPDRIRDHVEPPSVRNDREVMDDTEEKTLLYGFDGPFGRIVEDDNDDD